MTLNEYWATTTDWYFARLVHGPDKWRYGQTAFNVLRQYRPDLSEMIRSTDLDPFYREADDSDFWARFTRFIIEHWEA